jgi:hypothetical protein
MDAYTCYYTKSVDDGRTRRTEKCDYQTIFLDEAQKHATENPDHEVRDIHGRIVVADG